jgi:hypothetical protein
MREVILEYAVRMYIDKRASRTSCAPCCSSPEDLADSIVIQFSLIITSTPQCTPCVLAYIVRVDNATQAPLLKRLSF